MKKDSILALRAWGYVLFGIGISMFSHVPDSFTTYIVAGLSQYLLVGIMFMFIGGILISYPYDESEAKRG